MFSVVSFKRQLKKLFYIIKLVEVVYIDVSNVFFLVNFWMQRYEVLLKEVITGCSYNKIGGAKLWDKTYNYETFCTKWGKSLVI